METFAIALLTATAFGGFIALTCCAIKCIDKHFNTNIKNKISNIFNQEL